MWWGLEPEVVSAILAYGFKLLNSLSRRGWPGGSHTSGCARATSGCARAAWEACRSPRGPAPPPEYLTQQGSGEARGPVFPTNPQVMQGMLVQDRLREPLPTWSQRGWGQGRDRAGQADFGSEGQEKKSRFLERGQERGILRSLRQ